MRIALLTLSFPPQTGGVQTYLSELFKRVGCVHEVMVITPVTAAGTREDTFRRIRPSPANAVGFWRALRHLRPDRVVVGHAHPQLLVPAALYGRGRYLALAYGNDYLAGQRRWHRPLFNRLLARARPVVTITEANRRRLEGLGVRRPVVIYPGTDPERFVPAGGARTTAPVLLTVGRLVPRKGIDTVIMALPQLRAEFPELQYWIAGAGPDQGRLAGLVAELGLEDMVRFLGRVPDEELPPLYRQARIFVMPAREEREAASMEGFGIVYLEASASGLPVIAGRSGGAAEAVRDGQTGLVVEPSPDALRPALARLLADAELCRRMGTAGRRWVEEQMNWQRAANELLEVLERAPA